MPTITIRGLTEAMQAASAVPGRIEANTEASLDRVASSTLDDAKKDCPVRTGRLKNSLSVEKERLKRQIGTDVLYAGFVELGTSRQRPQPYLFPAWAKNGPALITDLKSQKIL
jgi:HK97 gp10 family phage protein